MIANAISVAGLAVMLSTLSYSVYQARVMAAGLRVTLGRPLPLSLVLGGLALFFAGRALNNGGGPLWETVLWWTLAISVAVQAALVHQSRSNLSLRSRVHVLVSGDRPLIAGLVALGVIMAALYALVILPWMQPDEPRHYQVASHVARLGQPIVTSRDRVPEWEQEMIAAMEQRSFWWYGFSMVGWDPNSLPESFAEIWGAEYATAFFQPPLYYALAGALLASWSHDVSLDDGIIRLRLVSLLFFALSLIGIYKTIAELFPERRMWAIGALALAALWPSHLAANAAVNNDVLAETLVVWSLYFAVNILRRGPNLGNVAWLVALALLGISTKRTALTATLVLPLTFLFWAFDVSGGHEARRRSAWITLAVSVPLGVALLGVFVAAGWVGLPTSFAADVASGAYWQALQQYPIVEHSNSLLHTFVGWFGWMRVSLPAVLYWLGGLLLALALFGVFRLPLDRRHSTLAGWQKRGLVLFAIAIVVQLVLIVGKQLLYADFSGESVPQIRYLYAVAPAVFLFLWLGWLVWVPQRFRRAMLPASIVLLLVFNAYIIGFLLYPFYWL